MLEASSRTQITEYVIVLSLQFQKLALIFAHLRRQIVDAKKMSLLLTGFLEKKTPVFMLALWTLLLSAQSNPLRVPTEILEEKKREMQAREAAEGIRRREEEVRMGKLQDMRGRERGERDDHRAGPGGASNRGMRGSYGAGDRGGFQNNSNGNYNNSGFGRGDMRGRGRERGGGGGGRGRGGYQDDRRDNNNNNYGRRDDRGRDMQGRNDDRVSWYHIFGIAICLD